MEFKTTSLAQTKKIAGLLAKEILNSDGRVRIAGAERRRRAVRMPKNALVLALAGDLGSGKTTFAQGFLRGLGIKNKITSPTFVIAKNYKLKTTNYKHAWHFDCYRIRKPAELFSLGFREILADPQNIILIEWPEVIKKVLPRNSIRINFEHGEKENQRTIKIIEKLKIGN